MRLSFFLLTLISTLVVSVGARAQSSNAPSAATLDGATIGARIDRYLLAMESFGFSGSIVQAPWAPALRVR